MCASAGNLPFGICAAAPPESLQVALRSVRSLPPAPQGGFKTLPQVMSWVAAAASRGNSSMADATDLTNSSADAAAGLKVIEQLAAEQPVEVGPSNNRMAAAGDNAGSSRKSATRPDRQAQKKIQNGKAPIAEAASGVGLLLKLLGNGTLYVTMNPARTHTPYKAACEANLP